MVKKLAFASFFFTSGNVDPSYATASQPSPSSLSCASSSTATSWQWPSCAHARTMSFGRADDGRDGAVSSTRRDKKTRVITNPAYRDDVLEDLDTPSFVSVTDSSASTVAWEPAMPVASSEVDEVIIGGIRSSSRLFFEPEATSSIVNKTEATVAFGGASSMAINSVDPYGDFRRSMEEMVLSHGGGGQNDWGWLEEMLGWYLRANGKQNHGLIVGAFVDLLVALTSGKQGHEF
ncbi:hypothetical protein ACQ4PT_006910 [Festuca glaucescens]